MASANGVAILIVVIALITSISFVGSPLLDLFISYSEGVQYNIDKSIEVREENVKINNVTYYSVNNTVSFELINKGSNSIDLGETELFLDGNYKSLNSVDVGGVDTTVINPLVKSKVKINSATKPFSLTFVLKSGRKITKKV